MMTFRTLLVGATVGVLLAVAGAVAVVASISTNAREVATRMAEEAARGGSGGAAAADPQDPPNFYGSR